ncbi:MAG: AmmeMemoRadiSam system protein A [Nitrospinae bacterium]|nr:AmmeMemoRadiSam system protein A [Nitrospinota bacterium]
MSSHPLVQLARETIELYIKTGKILSPPSNLTDEMKGRAGTFVSIKKYGELRGCIGTFSPTQSNIAAEVIQNAISAATRDPRFPSVTPEELDALNISVDVLTEPEKISSPDELDPKRYGVIVSKGWRKGLLLPDLEGVNTVEEQITIARRKAGILPEEEVELMRFKVIRYK